MTAIMKAGFHRGSLVVPSHGQPNGEPGGTSCKTASLVRLLREAEDGKGLEIDFSDALGEALGRQQDAGDKRRTAKPSWKKDAGRSLPLLERVSPLGGRRRFSRVIPDSSTEEDIEALLDGHGSKRTKENRQFHQRSQNPSWQSGHDRQPGAAPLDGGLIPIPSPVKQGKDRSVSFVPATQSQIQTSEVIHAYTVEASTSSGSSTGRYKHSNTREEHIVNGLSHQRADGDDFSRFSRFSSATTANGKDDGGVPMDAVTQDDIHRVYFTLQHRPEKNSRLRKRRTQSEDDVIDRPLKTGPSPRVMRPGGGRGRQEREKSSSEATVTTNIPYTRMTRVGSTPSVPTGAITWRTRRSKVPWKPLSTSAAADIATGGGDGFEAIKQGEQSMALAVAVPVEGKTATHPAAAESAREQQVEARTVGASPQAARAPHTDTGAASVDSTTAATQVPSPPTRSSGNQIQPQSELPSCKQMSATCLGGGGSPQHKRSPSPVEPTTVKLAEGLGAWANGTVKIGRRTDEENRRMAVERADETEKEEKIRRALERGMGTALEALPLSFLKDFGYLKDAQERGLEKTAIMMERLATAVQARAWAKWRNLTDSRRSAQPATSDTSVCDAVARGYLARRRVAQMRRLVDEAASRRTKRKEYLLQRRLAKVAAASWTVASCLIANAAARKRERVRRAKAAVAMVERSYIALKAREQGWREIVLYRKEHAAASMIQRWTRGVLVRRRTPLDRRIRRMAQNDARFAIREEVFVAHLVDHGAAVVIQWWWRTLRWRMRRLRMRYKHHLGVQATVIQRAYRRRLLRQGSKRNGRLIVSGGKAAADILSSILHVAKIGVGVGAETGGSGSGGGGYCDQDVPARLNGEGPSGARLNGAREGLASAGILSTRSALAAGLARSTVVLKTASDRAQFASTAAARASTTGTASTAGRLTHRFSTFAGTIGRAGASTHVRARTTLKMASAPIKRLLNRKKQDAAVTVAGLIMMKVASTKLLRRRKAGDVDLVENEEQAAKRIQNYVRARKHNIVIARRRDLFRAVCIQAMHRSTAKGKAGVVVHALGRRYVDRRRFTQTRRWVIGLQALVRGWLGRREAQSQIAHAQRLGEERVAGLVRWEQLARRREEEELVNGARSEDLADDLELQRTFMRYCRFGDRRNTGRMVVAKLTALCKDAGIIDKRFPVQRVEISFSRIKPKDLSHLPYSSFLAVLDDIALQHSDVRRLADAAAATTLEESVAVLASIAPTASVPATRSYEICNEDGFGDPFGRPPGNGNDHVAGSRLGTGGGTAHGSGILSGEGTDAGRGTHRNRHAGEGVRVLGAEGQGGRGVGKKRSRENSDTAASTSRPGGRSSPTAKAIAVARGKAGAAAVAGAAAAAGSKAAETVLMEGFRPDDQRLLVLLQKYILVKSYAGKEVCSEMAAEGRGARDRALARLKAAAVIVQARVARGCVGRALAREARERRETLRRHAMMNWAASLLQTRFRAFAAQTRVSKMAVKRYYRCLDDLTGAEYYFDPKTGKAWWTKPKILGKFDILTAVVVPAGEEIMVPMCHECAEEVATEICADCDEDMLCDLCVDRLHRAGNAAGHLRVPIDKCDECSFQVAVKHCKQCGDDFCVSCFAHLHRKGRLRRHVFEPLVAMCHDCGDRAQAFRCFGCEAEGRLLLCKPCLEARHAGLLPYQIGDHRVEAVGLRSMRVKHMREEKAARAKERWMKAESAAAGKRTRDKRMLAAAIKIQALWRGYLARKRRKYLMGEHLLWKMQRLRDDQIRKKRSYKIARFMGRARLLKSDTNQEIVLKQYPRWWQSTIMDIVRPTIGWHEGAKMVREQLRSASNALKERHDNTAGASPKEFFAKKTRRKGRWRVHPARVRLRGAQVRLQVARYKQRKREMQHASAAEVYRHARAKGGVSAESKENLQQISRKAKRAVKKQEESCKKMETKVEKAEDRLEALIGPFRLRKTVTRALTKGMLMPFPVSVQRGKANARLERGRNMREVLKWMPYGRRVCIKPVEGSMPPPSATAARKSVVVVPAVESARPRPPSHALGPFFVLGVKESQQKEQKEVKGLVAIATAAGAFSGRSEATESGGRKTSTGGGDNGGAEAAAGDGNGVGKLVGAASGGEGVHDTNAATGAAVAVSSPLLVLDRQWQLEDASQCQAFAMPILPPPQKVLMIASTGLRDSFAVQAALKVAAVGAHMRRDRLQRWQAKFDDDSPMHARLERWAVGSEALSQSFMLRRRKLFDVEKGFDDEKRKVAEAVELALSIWSRLQDMADFAKSAAATGLASKQGGDGKGIIGGKLGREVVLQLFKKWVQSDDRAKVIIMHRSGKGANDPAIEVVQVVGYIKIDLDTPTPVLREFIRRYCGGWLNEHAKGDRFVMESSTGGLVRRSREGAKFTATAMDMVQERVNKSTRDTEAVIFVQDEKSRMDPDAEVEVVLIPEKELLDPESTPIFDDEDSIDGEGEDRDGRSSRKGAREKNRSASHNEEGGGGGEEESDVGQDSDGFGSEEDGSIGSLGSDLETHEEDPFAAMERDLQDAVEDEAHVKHG